MANYHYPKTSEDLWKKKIRQRRKQRVRRKLNLERTRRVFEYDPNPSMLVPADLLTPPNSEKKKPQDAQQQGFTENHELEDNGERPKLTLVRPEEDPHDQTHPTCLLYTSPSPRDRQKSRMPSSA